MTVQSAGVKETPQGQALTSFLELGGMCVIGGWSDHPKRLHKEAGRAKSANPSIARARLEELIFTTINEREMLPLSRGDEGIRASTSALVRGQHRWHPTALAAA